MLIYAWATEIKLTLPDQQMYSFPEQQINQKFNLSQLNWQFHI